MFRRILPAAALLCAVFAAPAHAQHDWTPAGQLVQPRTGMASAVLNDGRVLLAGGWVTKSQQDVATVDIYDPRMYAWMDAPPLGEPRRSPSAVTLRDGRVLVLGGEDQSDQRTAEIFDPVANAWTPAASSTAPHVSAPGFVLGDGRVLFLGGGWYWSEWPGGEIYDPSTGSWSITAPPHKVAAPAVVRLRDGRFLAVGVEFVNDYSKPAAEIYDATSNTWTVVAPPQRVGQASGAALLPDGRVLVAGGRPLGAELPDVTAHSGSEIFDPATGSWSPTGDLNRPRGSGSAAFVALADGRVAAVGGAWATIVGPFGQRRFGDIFYEATAEIYDAATGKWQVTQPMSQARTGHVGVRLGDGSLLMVGGVTGANGTVTPTAERLVPPPTPVAAPAPPVVVAPPTVTSRPKAGTLRFLKPPKRLKPTRGGTLVIKVRCSGSGEPCTDRLVLRGRGRLLAQRAVSGEPGETIHVQVRLGAAARRALRHRTTRVTVTLQRQRTKVNVNVRG